MQGVLEHNHTRLQYEVLGHGEPVLVFCHGLGGDRTAAKELVGPLNRYRLVVWDCRGHGASGPAGPPEYYTFSSFAEDLRGLLDHLGIERPIIGGVSMGAALSAHFALRWPERVGGLVLARPAWIDHPLTRNLALFPVIAELLVRSGPMQGLDEFRRLPEVREIAASCPYTFQSLCQHFGAAQAVDRSVRLDRLPRDAPIRTWEEVKHLQTPALIVGNEDDMIHPLEFAIQWAERTPGGELVLIESKARDEGRHVCGFRACLRAFLRD